MHQRIPQLDAVRGIAILVVMLHNSGTFPRLFAHGWMGVDLFFVLSGFLITGILLDTKQSEGYFNNFYIRRCLRIWPLYYSALVFHVRPGSFPAPVGSVNRLRSSLVTVVGVSVVSPEFPGSDSYRGHWTARSNLVPCC